MRGSSLRLVLNSPLRDVPRSWNFRGIFETVVRCDEEHSNWTSLDVVSSSDCLF
jgi:hypothetical protein